jgi:DNA excision repair protein ERCC-2
VGRPDERLAAGQQPAARRLNTPVSEPLAAGRHPAVQGAAAWSYRVSVRSLCEFTAKQGDLDRRFTPSATALEGQMGQLTVASRRGGDYETEITLQGLYGPGGALQVGGRADGYDPRRRCLEEIKTIRGHPDDIPVNRRQLHWAQLQSYGALFCRARGLQELALALVYFDVASQSEVELLQVFGADELEQTMVQRCQQFLGWAQQEAAHRAARDKALATLAFPPGEFRPGQRQLSQAVYRAATRQHCLLAQAPTGIGKTVGTLFPLLRALPAHGSSEGLDKLAYLTHKGTGRFTALQALEGLREGTAGQALRVLALVPKEQACEHPDKACHGDACPLARGFYDRLDAARSEAVDTGWLDAAAQRSIALRHGLCPYYLGQELLRWADVLVGDVHHCFDPNGQLWGLSQALDWRLGVLVDEAHNLVERARRMYSAALSLQQIEAALQVAPAAVVAALQGLQEAASALAAQHPGSYAVLPDVPELLGDALQTAASALAEHFHRHPLELGPLLGFHFELQRFVKLADTLDSHSLFDLQRDAPAAPAPSADLVPRLDADPELLAVDPTQVTFSIRNVVPAFHLRPRWAALPTATLFSATLAPPAYAQQMLGLPEGTQWLDVPPVFPPEHLQVRVADGLSTRYRQRHKTLTRLVDILATQFHQHPGNYLAFFSSFVYLEQAADDLARRWPDVPQWRQSPGMDMPQRQAFLDRFQAGGQGIAFAVLGGVFAEGVDLPGTRLIGAFIATLALPPVSPLQDQIKQRLDTLFGAEHGFADLVPAMQKVVQAAGRVLRSPEDRGWLWLLDERYRRPEVVRLLPAWWGVREVSEG